MGNKRNCIWVVQLFTSAKMDELLKTYEFNAVLYHVI